MKKRKPNAIKVRRRISDCKRRLDNLKKQGFHFSQDVYADLNNIKYKILQDSLIHRIWNKKIQIFTVVFSLVVFILVLYLLLFQNEMNIVVENVHDGMIIDKNINETFLIQGTTSHQNKWIPSIKISEITLVQIRVDEDLGWESVNGTDDWSYSLNVSNLKTRTYNFSFRCTNGEDSFEINKTDIKIINSSPPPTDHEQTVIITNPFEGENISGIVPITGFANTEVGAIDSVRIQINNSIQWFNATINDNTWRFNWNTENLNQGNYSIYAKSFDGKNESKIDMINVTVKNRTWEPPPDGPFNFFIPQKYEADLLEPGNIYEVKGIHKASRELGHKSYTKISTFLKVQGKRDWLEVTLPQEEIITPKDGVNHSFSILISINETAPKNSDSIFTIAWTPTFYPWFYSKSPKFANFLNWLNQDTYDITIYTGEW